MKLPQTKKLFIDKNEIAVAEYIPEYICPYARFAFYANYPAHISITLKAGGNLIVTDKDDSFAGLMIVLGFINGEEES